jgi:hypothetical protein
MKRLVITESEKQRILGMHQIAANKMNLFEQSTDAKLNEILATNNGEAWKFINAVIAAEDGGTLGTVDEDAIVKLVQGITTTDLYIAILWNIRNNVQDNYCSLYGWATKSMFKTRGGEEVKMVDLVTDMDRDYRNAISNKTNELCASAKKYYPFFQKLAGDITDPYRNKSMDSSCFDNGSSTGKKGCKGDWTTGQAPKNKF